MSIRILIGISLVSIDIVLAALAQIDIIPDGLGNLLQLPILAAFIWLTISFLKWHHEQSKMMHETHDKANARMVEDHQERIKMLLDTHSQTVTMLLGTYEQRLNKMSDKMELNGQQLAINTVTVNESIRTSELIEEVKGSLVALLINKDNHD